jgi:hypothetical protein
VLTRDAILGADDLPKEKVEVPEWGGEVYVRTMTGAERDAFEKQWAGGKVPDNVRAGLVAKTVVDESGTRLFKDSDVTNLGAKSALVLDRLFDVAQKLNGLSKRDVEVLEKNSERIPPDSSAST